MSEKNHDIYFQTVHITAEDPQTGKQFTRQFVGKALFTPEQIKANKDADIHEIIKDIAIDKPYNPYDDPENNAAHEKALKLLRNALGDSNA